MSLVEESVARALVAHKALIAGREAGGIPVHKSFDAGRRIVIPSLPARPGLARICSQDPPKTFCVVACQTQFHATMAKSANKRLESVTAQKQSDRPFIAVDQKALDPSLSSLFASSVRHSHLRQLRRSLILSRNN